MSDQPPRIEDGREPDKRSEPEAADDAPHRKAVKKASHWPGWIWAVPVAALGIVLWLGLQSLLGEGPTVTVTFETAGGIKPGNTDVRYKDMRVGEVQSVKFQKDLQHVDVKLRLDSTMDGHLGPGTRFWIAGQKVSLGNLASIKNIIGGPHIGIEPHDGKTQHHFRGLDAPPVLETPTPGTQYELHADTLGSVSQGSKIYYLDLAVGEVLDTRLAKDAHSFDITAFIQAPYDRLVHTGSRFWNAGAVQISTENGSPKLQMQSVSSLLSGAIAFETPSGPEEGGRAPQGYAFRLFSGKDKAVNAVKGDGVPYRAIFTGSVAGLTVGSPVQLIGQEVGVVRSLDTAFDVGTGEINTEAVLALDPTRIQVTGLQMASLGNDMRGALDQVMSKLIGKGLRAEIDSSMPVIGQKIVALKMVPGAKPAVLGPGPIPEIPSTTGSDISAIMANVGEITNQVRQMPFDAIGAEVHQITGNVARLSSSPELTASLQHLDQSLANIQELSHQARDQVGPILAAVRRAAQEAETTLASAKALIGNNAAATSGPETAGLPHTLYELQRAARSLRELADFLDRHPEALLKGKGNNQ